jgi:glycosyltransferase involved in cell wall biosynthesis
LNILFIAPFPPPITGQSLAAKVIYDEICVEHKVEIIDLSKGSYKSGVNSIFRIGQVINLLKDVKRKKKRADVIYLTVSESITGNIKDILLYIICLSGLHKMIIHLHGGAGMRNIILGNLPILRIVNSFFLRRLGAIIVLGNTHRAIYSRIVSAAKIRTVPNFAEDALYVPEIEIRAKFNIEGPLKLLFLSNMIEGKGHHELVDAFKDLDARYKSKAVLELAGGFESISQRERFLRKIEGERQIQYVGVVEGERKRKILATSHILCLPTYYSYEGQPICILEAYAAGCVVITTNHSGIRDIFRDCINGYEVGKRSVCSIRTGIVRCLEDRGRLLEMALFNRHEADGLYRSATYVLSIKKIFHEVLIRNSA